MGALVMTENSKNIDELFPGNSIVAYNDPDHLESLTIHFLEQQSFREQIAASGQAHTIAHHNYGLRMKDVSDVLKTALTVHQ
jgi:spore maturation protein CgeB